MTPGTGATAGNALSDIFYSLEKLSEHPLAEAVVNHLKESASIDIQDFESITGKGVKGRAQGRTYLAGNRKLLEENHIAIPPSLQEEATRLTSEAQTVIWFADEENVLAIAGITDRIKETSIRAVSELHAAGIEVHMLTGDNERTARAIGAQAGVDEVIAGVLPDGKEAVISRLKEKGKVAMVGDGINDAPALTSADIGIAIGAGTDIAIDAADVVLMKSRLSDVPAAIRLSRATLRNIHENLFWAFIYNIIGIPLAAGVWIPLFGWKLNPMFGAAAMSLSSFCVVTNALRLNLFRMHDASKDKRIKNEIQKEDLNMTTEQGMVKTMTIEGMMCGHCEARVKKTLEAIEGVASAEVSHEKGTAVVTLTAPVSDNVLKTAVEAQDYTVKGIQ